MQTTTTTTVIDQLRHAAHPLSGAATDYDQLLDLVGDARYVLIGEASHGTHEFYQQRAEITKRLITEKGFTAVAVEADWPDAYRVNCYVRGASDDAEAIEPLAGFQRFPTWMWRNADVLDFIGWLREHNDQLPESAVKTGFYGLDLYSLYRSMTEVVRYLERVDPEAATRARQRYACFDHYGDDGESYAYGTAFGASKDCEDAVIGQLVELQRQIPDYARRDGPAEADAAFYAEQKSRLAKNAEEYYRTMMGGRVSSWNLRDTHMVETLDALVAHLDHRRPRTKIVVWEHNSHLGDARATEIGAGGELNVGQLVRERHGEEARLIGFSTDHGSVTAADDWGEPAQRQRVRPALPESYEALFHRTEIPRFLLTLRGGGAAVEALRAERLERAIGVIYRPETERVSHYFHARLPDQFDAILHFDETRG
jgi:erythromycin esterase-like protein